MTDELAMRAHTKLRSYAESAVAVRMERAEARALAEAVERMRTALCRIASTETFTAALDLNHPELIEPQALVDEIQARMRHASEALQ